ncbi:hypothetical protein [Undibacterium terreum]|uniref:Uncharacterized protein n=1 Tax=Undibacterium terreum TaxID=1224302 RepID=A0A916XSA1_9BURK|nr:hypothetical protein [Undibacterium terreum]GGC98762.1 hypothetical protein GCM10011396_52870 [Undibacterium terreum]
MKLDRTLQREILTMLAACYPAGIHPLTQKFPQYDEATLFANMVYLDELKLIHSGVVHLNLIDEPGKYEDIDFSKITAKGLDLLLNDGGVSAIHAVTAIEPLADTAKAE